MFNINYEIMLRMLMSYKLELEKRIHDGIATDKDRIQYYRAKKSINEIKRKRKQELVQLDV